jgi:hypothetical protein
MDNNACTARSYRFANRARHYEPQHLSDSPQREWATEPALDEPGSEEGFTGIEEGESEGERKTSTDQDTGRKVCGNYRNSDRHVGIWSERDECPYRNAGGRPKNGYALAYAEDNPDPCRQEIGKTHRDGGRDRTQPRLI